jgi:hypothetical protein
MQQAGRLARRTILGRRAMVWHNRNRPSLPTMEGPAMKPSTCIALLLTLGAGLYAAAAPAQDAAAAAAAQSAPAPDAALAAAQTSAHHHPLHKVHHTRHSGGKRYDQCLKEKAAAADYYCNSHGDACQAEKDGVEKQCRSEARGEKQTG